MDIADELRKKTQFASVAAFVAVLLLIPAPGTTDEPREGWKAKAEEWKAEAEKWEAIASNYEEKYGWVND